MTGVPEVTVVIPTCNRWDMLESCGLRSALGQEGVELEVVVVDDGSVDGTSERLAGAADSRVRVVRHESSRGVAAARNAGIAAARGEWIAFLDDDDLWSPRKLRAQLDAARRSGASIVYAGVVVVDASRNIVQATSRGPTSLEQLLERNTIPAGSSNVLVRAARLREVDCFDERLTYVADWDLWIRLAATWRLAFCPDILVGYVRHGNGMVFAGAEAIEELRYFVAKHRGVGLRADPAAVPQLGGGPRIASPEADDAQPPPTSAAPSPSGSQGSSSMLRRPSAVSTVFESAGGNIERRPTCRLQAQL